MIDIKKRTIRLGHVLFGIVVGMTLLMATVPHLYVQSQASAAGQETMTAKDLRDRDTLMSVGGVIGMVLQGVTDPARIVPADRFQ